MVRRDPSRHSGPKRTGKTLVLFALLLPLLLGMVGLAIDGGLLLAAYRQTQNAADTAALSAAYDLLNNLSAASATTTGTTYVQTNNNMANATVTINIPPSSGPHAGSASFAEALISYPYQTSFIQLLGVNTNQTVGARAVAGFEGSTTGAGITTLQQSTTSGGGNVGIMMTGLTQGPVSVASRVPGPISSPVMNKKFCANCGKSMPVKAIFCPGCGEKAD